MNSISAEKNLLRKRFKEKRTALNESVRLQKSTEIARNLLSVEAINAAQSLFCFVSYGSEVHTHPIIKHLLSQKKQVSVPQINAVEHMNAMQITAWEDLEPGPLGILTVKSPTAPVTHVDITLTPGLVFGPRGERLGYGRGYYDKWFAANDAGLKIALAYELQIAQQLPGDSYDVNVDIIITEQRIIRV